MSQSVIQICTWSVQPKTGDVSVLVPVAFLHTYYKDIMFRRSRWTEHVVSIAA
jgi:hypothetical protein